MLFVLDTKKSASPIAASYSLITLFSFSASRRCGESPSLQRIEESSFISTSSSLDSKSKLINSVNIKRLYEKLQTKAFESKGHHQSIHRCSRGAKISYAGWPWSNMVRHSCSADRLDSLVAHNALRQAKRGFPSWSWADWLGEVFLPSVIQDIDHFKQWADQHTPGKFSLRPGLSISDELEVRNVLECRGVWALFRLEETWVYQENFENPLWMLKDARGLVCGHVQIHDWPRFREELERLSSKVTVFILSDRVPGQGQFLIETESLDYDHNSEPSLPLDDEGAGATERLPEFPITASKARLKRVGAQLHHFHLSTTTLWWPARK